MAPKKYSYQNSTGLVEADPEDPCWMPLKDKPTQNGWYDVCAKRGLMGPKVSIDVNYILALALYRDGEWVDVPGGCIGWRLPLKMEDSKGKPIQNIDGAINLGEAILQDARRQFTESFKALITADRKYAPELVANYLSENRRSFSTYIMGGLIPQGVEPQDIIYSLCNEVLIANKISEEHVNKVRKLIHGTLKWYKSKLGTAGYGFDPDATDHAVEKRNKKDAYRIWKANNCNMRISNVAEKRNDKLRQNAAITACAQIKRIMRRYKGLNAKNQPLKKKGNALGIPKKVRCIETGEIFDSIQSAANKYKGSTSCLSHCLRGIQHTFKKMHWEYV